MNKKEVLKFLEKVINQNSKTSNRGDVNKVADLVEKELKVKGITTKRYKSKTNGDLLVAKTKSNKNGPKILLSAHMDIVVPPELHQKYEDKGSRIYGTGADDLKGGLTSIVFVMKQLAEKGIPNVTATFIPDEETGSYAHDDRLHKLYAKQDYALVFESTRSSDKNPEKAIDRSVVVERKGILVYRVHAKGKNAHSGTTVKKKDRISAISELIHKLEEIQKLQDFGKGTTINVGVINGGISFNTISDSATAEFDVRIKNPAEFKRMKKAIDKILKKPYIKGASTSYELIFEGYPMTQSNKSKKLSNLIVKTGKSLGLNVTLEKRGGGSDANQISLMGIPVVDGMGPGGKGSHNPESFIYKESLFKSITLSSHVIEKLAQ